VEGVDSELISKKELLELTGISYGQLYRWKRKNLIPEEWFIRKSTFTGQETFFEREKILERINKIMNMKDGLSLDDIAGVFSPQLYDIVLNKQELIQREIVSPMAMDVYTSLHGEAELFSFEKILNAAALEKILNTGSVSLEEGKLVLQNLEDNYRNFKDGNCEILFIRKFGAGVSLLIDEASQVYFDNSCKIAARVKLSELIEEIKNKLFL
jgi:DNA-binding transcriptional MerR regulator